MTFPFFILIMVALTIVLMLGRRQFDDLLKHQHAEHSDAWQAAGRPIGFFWQPEEGTTWTEGTQARGRTFWSWMRTTPDWMPGELKWKLTIIRVSVVCSYLGFILAGVGLLLTQGG